jgi:hypothetical protein
MDNNGLRFEALSAADAGRLAAVLALGMCVAVREHVVTPQYACDKLFRPSLLQTLRALGVASVVCEAVAEALELEDIAELAEAALIPLLDRIATALVEFLGDVQGLRERTSWIDRIGIGRQHVQARGAARADRGPDRERGTEHSQTP